MAMLYGENRRNWARLGDTKRIRWIAAGLVIQHNIHIPMVAIDVDSVAN